MTAAETYRRFTNSMTAGTDAWRELLADDVSLTGPLAAVSGKAAFIEVNVPFFAGLRRYEVEEVIEREEQVITRVKSTVATPGGQEVTLSVSEWYTIREGKLQSLRVYFDPRALLAAM